MPSQRSSSTEEVNPRKLSESWLNPDTKALTQSNSPDEMVIVSQEMDKNHIIDNYQAVPNTAEFRRPFQVNPSSDAVSSNRDSGKIESKQQNGQIKSPII